MGYKEIKIDEGELKIKEPILADFQNFDSLFDSSKVIINKNFSLKYSSFTHVKNDF